MINYGYISNVRFKAVTHKDVYRGTEKKIRWIMTVLNIAGNKIGYYNDHYYVIPIPLPELSSCTAHFGIELSNGLSFDTQDYIEVTFDYYKTNLDYDPRESRVVYDNFRINQNLFGPIYLSK